jgi:HlyD family secretion protein
MRRRNQQDVQTSQQSGQNGQQSGQSSQQAGQNNVQNQGQAGNRQANAAQRGNNPINQYYANAVFTPVETGINNDQFIEIVSGLKEGDEVVLPQLTAGSGQQGAMQGGMQIRAFPGGAAPNQGGAQPQQRNNNSGGNNRSGR